MLVGIRKEFTNKQGHLGSLCAIPIRKTVASLHLREMSKKTKEDETIQIKMLGSSPFIKTSRLGRLKRLAERASPSTRADKGWAVKRARPSKKVWCSGLGPYLDMSLVFEFGQGLRCGLSIRHCPVTELWRHDLFFCTSSSFLWAGTLFPRGKCCYFLRKLEYVDKHLFRRVSHIASMTLPLNSIFVLLLSNVDVIPKQRQLSTV